MNPSSIDFLFMTRGKGWGHSIRDIAIAQELSRIDQNFAMYFASYSDGLKCYETKKIETTIPLPENKNDQEFSDAIIHLYDMLSPKVVIAAELVEAERIAVRRGIPCIFVTNYLEKNEHEKLRSDIVFAEFKDTARYVPKHVSTFFDGPIFTHYQRTPDELNSTKNYILVLLGGSSLNLVKLENIWLLRELFKIEIPEWKWVVVGKEYQKYFPDIHNAIWEERQSDLTETISKCQFAITRGGITTLWEMAYSGTPFIAVPYSSSVNPMELFYANTMAIRGLGTVCTYKDIKEGNKLRDEIDYFCRYSREIGDQIIEKTKFYLKNDGSELAAKSIANLVE